MLEAMAGARAHINMDTYILDEGEVAERFAEVLEKKARAGVRVHFMYDAVGSLKAPKEYFDRLRQAGVGVCEFGPVRRLGRLNHRNHRKLLVVDGRVAFTGGINVSQTYASGSGVARAKPGKETKEGWRDTQVRVEGPVVAQFQRAYLDTWAAQPNCEPMAKAEYFPKLEPRGDKAMRFVKASPEEGSEMYSVLLDALESAKRRIWLTFGYFVPDPRMKQALIDAARRGVDVELVLPGFSDSWVPVNAGRSHYRELLAAGVKIHEWHEALLHAKTAVIDSRWSSVGSTNLDWRSFVHNYEADVIIEDAAFAREMERRFRLDVEAARHIDPEEWARRGQAQKVKEWIARQWEYLL
ncbi:MAG TPA: phospholipase D-like domain-containing protein [Burkholderiales bacterium]|nr:phospholipase D-like domain-containing protein [Burkholderiales bacterium]